jgi:putative membrane protein
MKDEHVLLGGVAILVAVILFPGTPWCPFGWGPWMGPWFIFPIFGLLFLLIMLRAVFGDGHGHGMCGMGHSHNEEKSPLDILNERYARGEITREQYQEMKREIM